VTLPTILHFIVSIFHQHGAIHASDGAVNHVLGWVVSKHWLVKVCRLHTVGCSY
jgi:hypothetical protein